MKIKLKQLLITITFISFFIFTNCMSSSSIEDGIVTERFVLDLMPRQEFCFIETLTQGQNLEVFLQVCYTHTEI
jgi:hypothetical protein